MQLEITLPVLTVFAQGLLSFFSPCVLPLVPLYLGYLAAGAKTVDENGGIRYRRGRVALNTFFFVLGISFAFFLLTLGFTAVGRFFTAQKTLFTRIGGILVILFGLYQLGIFGNLGALSRERRLPFRLDRLTMGPLPALALGFVFSFGWTPCVGPALAGVLVMASTAQSAAMGFVLIGVYTLGFVLPFLAVGLFAAPSPASDWLYGQGRRCAACVDGDYDLHRLDERNQRLSVGAWRELGRHLFKRHPEHIAEHRDRLP